MNLNSLNYTADAMRANMGFVVAQTAYVETQVYEQRYGDIQYTGLIPIDYSAPEWIKSVTYRSLEMAGRARWIADRASDIPVVGTARNDFETEVYMAGIGYDYGLEEIMQAQMLGMNLDATKAMAARRGYEEFMDDLLLVTGDANKGFSPLINYPGITAGAAPNGDWGSTGFNEDDALDDFNSVITGQQIAVNWTTGAMADTILLPHTKMQYLGKTRLGDTSMTLLDWIATKNVYTFQTGKPLTIRGIRGLDTAGAGSTPRMVAYRRSPEVLKAHVPMRHRFLPVQVEGLTFKVPGIFRTGGLDIRLPKEVRYLDGI